MEVNACSSVGLASRREAKLAVVTVTYGKRWQYLRQVLQELTHAASLVHRIFVVSNGSDEDISANVAMEFSEHNIEIITLRENTGSANGFGVGMLAASASDSELILLLDDDNVILGRDIARLLCLYDALGASSVNVLTCLRETRYEYRHAIYSTGRFLEDRSSFLWFSFWGALKKAMQRKKPNDRMQFPLIALPYAPYGGTLFAKSWLGSVGLPNKEFFVYFDDHDFFSRFVKGGANIYLCGMIAISDVDVSWNRAGYRGHFLFTNSSSDEKVYYSVRNKIYLQRGERKTLTYLINAVLYLSGSFIRTLFNERDIHTLVRRSRLLYQAIGDGRRGRLGVVGQRESAARKGRE